MKEQIQLLTIKKKNKMCSSYSFRGHESDLRQKGVWFYCGYMSYIYYFRNLRIVYRSYIYQFRNLIGLQELNLPI